MAAPTPLCDLPQLLPQLVKYSDICKNQQSVCTLMSVSWALGASLSQLCLGKVEVSLNISNLRQAQSFADWLRQHAKLLSLLEVSITRPHATHSSKDAAVAAIASALQYAAAEPRGLFLQAVKLVILPECTDLLLQLQGIQQLTQLDLAIRTAISNPATEVLPHKDVRHRDPLFRALAGFTNIRKLALKRESIWGAPSSIDPFMPALSHLTQLTALNITKPRSPASLQDLPQQLQHLKLNSLDYLSDGQPEPLQLGHLTALTILDDSQLISYSMSEPRVKCNLVIRQGDVLPSNLEVLLVKTLCSVAPLKRLQQLRKLVLSDCSMSADDLRMLAIFCPQLQDVHLWYQTEVPESCALAWEALPITALHLAYGDVSLSILQCIEQHATRLKCLDVRRGSIKASMQQLAATVAQLSSLQTLLLELSGCSQAQQLNCHAAQLEVQQPVPLAQQHQVQQEQSLIGAVLQQCHLTLQQHPLHALMQAIAGLPQLTCLLLGSPDTAARLSTDACAALSTASELTSLKLCNCGIRDAHLLTLTPTLAKLKDLVLSLNRGITDVGLIYIAQHFRQLKRLDVAKTSVSSEGVQQLRQAGKLGGVLVTGTAGFAARSGSARRAALKRRGQLDINE